MRAAFIVPCIANLLASQFRVPGFRVSGHKNQVHRFPDRPTTPALCTQTKIPVPGIVRSQSLVKPETRNTRHETLLSPRLHRNLAPALLANDFYGIDARQHLIRNRQALGERLTHRLRAIKTGLAHQPAVGRARIERRAGHARKCYQSPVSLEASSKSQEHFPLVEYIHVFVEYECMLEPDVRS